VDLPDAVTSRPDHMVNQDDVPFDPIPLDFSYEYRTEAECVDIEVTSTNAYKQASFDFWTETGFFTMRINPSGMKYKA
jgi:hypothetical protein